MANSFLQPYSSRIVAASVIRFSHLRLFEWAKLPMNSFPEVQIRFLLHQKYSRLLWNSWRFEIKDWTNDGVYADGVTYVGNDFFCRFIDHRRLVEGEVVDWLRIDALHGCLEIFHRYFLVNTRPAPWGAEQFQSGLPFPVQSNEPSRIFSGMMQRSPKAAEIEPLRMMLSSLI